MKHPQFENKYGDAGSFVKNALEAMRQAPNRVMPALVWVDGRIVAARLT